MCFTALYKIQLNIMPWLLRKDTESNNVCYLPLNFCRSVFTDIATSKIPRENLPLELTGSEASL